MSIAAQISLAKSFSLQIEELVQQICSASFD